MKYVKKMKKHIARVFFTLVLIGITGYNVYNSLKPAEMSDIALANIEALASGEDGSIGCGGNPTYIPNEALRTANCWNGGTHKKCKSENSVCCNPSEQTDCKGVI